MDSIFLTGIIGSVILVIGASLPAKKVVYPVQSAKNWLFAIGSFCMLIYAVMQYRSGGEFFYVILEILVNVASVLMMINIRAALGTAMISTTTLVFVAWSLTIFEEIYTLLFVIGLGIIGIGFILETGSRRRNILLAVGPLLVACYSYIVAEWVFFWLNLLFAIFSAYHALKLMPRKTQVTTKS